MKKFLFFIACNFAALPLLADDIGISAISSSADEVSSYLPVLRSLCFAIAGVVAIIGAYSAYYDVQRGQEIQKKVLATAGSAMCFVMLAFGLPKFFGYDETGFDTTGLIAQTSDTGTGTSSLAGNNQGVPGSGVITEIPDINSPQWSEQHSPMELLSEYGNVSSTIAGKDVINMDDLWNTYTFYMSTSNSHPGYYYNTYSSDIDYLLSKNDYDFDAAYSEALMFYENQCAWEDSPDYDGSPYSSSDYWRICQAISALQQVSCDVTWWRYSGEFGPPSAGWENTFFP